MPLDDRESQKQYIELNLMPKIHEHGYTILCVAPCPGDDPPRPRYAYTLGLLKSYGHPELVIAIPDFDWAYPILSNFVDEIKKGCVFRNNETTHCSGMESRDGASLPTRLRTVSPGELDYSDWFGIGCVYHDSPDFPILQLVWPDSAIKFPGDEDAHPSVTAMQTLGIVDRFFV